MARLTKKQQKELDELRKRLADAVDEAVDDLQISR